MTIGRVISMRWRSGAGQWIAEVKVQIEAAEQLPPQAKIRAQLFSGNDLIIEESAPVESPAGHAATKAKEVLLSLAVNKPRLWDIDDPFLYRLEVALLDESGRAVDMQEIRTAFRTAEFGPSGFYLNHRRVFLRGLNRHQEYPYTGYAMGPDAQRRDAEMLKQELGCIIVRTSHYPQSPYFLDACDELGLLVFEELPGWQHVGDASWQEHAPPGRGMKARLAFCNFRHKDIALPGHRMSLVMNSPLQTC